MNSKKKNAVKALKNLGLDKSLVKAFEKSSSDIYLGYYGRNRALITKEILEKCYELARKRSKCGIEIIGILFYDNLDIKFLFYIDGNPEEVFFERNIFFNVEDLENELDRQLDDCFDLVHELTDSKRVFYKENFYLFH